MSVSAVTTVRAEQFRYRFDHPSSIDTSGLVPHFFEQKYDTVPVWLGAEATYTLGGLGTRTSLAVSRLARTRGSDIDTFIIPSGDVATSGTDGHVMLGSFELSHRMTFAEGHGWSANLSGRFRRDRAEFLPDDRIVTHTRPTSIVRTFITDHETTVSQVIGIGATISHERLVAGYWRAEVSAMVEPLVRGRLSIVLPEKYPGVDLLYYALSASARLDAALVRRAEHWHVGLRVQGVTARGYRSTAAYGIRGLGVSVFAGLGAR